MKRFATIACLAFVVSLFGYGIASAQTTYPGGGPGRGMGYGWRAVQATSGTQTGGAWRCPRSGRTCVGNQWGKYGGGGGRHGWNGWSGDRPCWRVR